MKWLKLSLIIFFLLIIITTTGGWFYLRSFSPDYDESRAFQSLEKEAEVYYDQFGVPHIYAQSDADAYHILGYVHAKDRLWQMEILRRIAPGRLSEILGEATISTDRFFKHLQLSETSAQAVEEFDTKHNDEIKVLVAQYLEGINQFIASGNIPIEYKILGIKPDPFSVEDIYNVMGYMAFSFAMAHKTEPVATYILEKLGADYLKDLNVHVDTTSEMIKSYDIVSDPKALSSFFKNSLKELPSPQLIGSNSWVLSPSKTNTNAVLFANDPHIGYASPSVWYEAHIETSTLSLYGNYIAGFPFAQMGHTPHHAIGLTMFENDDIDFFEEKTDGEHPDSYWHNGEWKTFRKKTVVLKVKDKEDVIIDLLSSVHGPVITPEAEGFDKASKISMWWVYQQNPVDLINASYTLLRAKSLEEVALGASKIAAPGLNIMYGDVEGNVAWWAAAKLPKRADHVNSKLILDGSGADDPLGYFDFSENPHAINPPWGYVYSANNQSYKSIDILHPGYYLPEDRAKRIVHLLDQKNDWGASEVQQMMLDITSENAAETAKNISEALNEIDSNNWPSDDLTFLERSIEQLESWQGTYDDENAAPVIFTKLLFLVVKRMMADELGDDLFEMYNGTHLMKRSTQPLIANDQSRWWDDINTPYTEKRIDILKSAFLETINQLKSQLGNDMSDWKWSKIHTLEHNHLLGSNATLRPYFNVGPFNTTGSTDVINNMQFHLEEDGTYEVKAGPSCRRIVDFSNVRANSWSILPTGNSGNVMSPYYKDQAEMYVNGQYRKQMMDKAEIQGNAAHKSVFIPK